MPFHTIQFSEGEAKDRGSKLVRLIEQDVQDRSEAVEMREYIRNVYYGSKLRDKQDPGESDQHLHLLTEKVETIVSKEMNAFFAADPHVHVQRVPSEFDEEETRANERMVNWAIDTDIPKFYTNFESWLRNRHLDGVAVMKAWYNQADRNALVTETADTMWKQGEIDFALQPVPQDRLKLPYEVLADKFPQLEIQRMQRDDQEVDPLEEQELVGLTAWIDFVENRRQIRGVRVEFHDNPYVDQIELYIFRPVMYKDNVEVDLVEFEDIIVPYRAKDLQCAERVTQRYWLTYEEILTKGWNLTEEDLVKLKARSTIHEEEDMENESDTLKDQKDRITGQHQSNMSPRRRRTTTHDADMLEPYRSDKILILEVYAREDLDQDGVWEEVVYQIPYALEKIVDAAYLEEIFPHGRRPFADIHSIPISNRFYSWSLGQILAPINVEVNTIINQTNKAQEIINNPFFFYVPTSFTTDKQQTISLEPGEGVPVADVNAVMFPKFPQEPLANLSAGLDPLLLFADRVSVSPQAAGSSQVRNAPRTARGTLALLSEAGARIDSFITAAQKGGWAELMFQIWALYDHYASDEKWAKVTGKERARKIGTTDLMDQMKFSFKGNTVNTNREVMRTLAQLRYTILSASPLYASDPMALRALTENFLQHFSEGADVDKLMPNLPGMGGMRQPMDQETEIQIMLQGMPVDVLPFDDDMAHIKKIEEFRRSTQFESLDQTQVTLLAYHERLHQQQLMRKQQEQQMQAGGNQGNNVPLGAGQSDMNALEGGIV